MSVVGSGGRVWWSSTGMRISTQYKLGEVVWTIILGKPPSIAGGGRSGSREANDSDRRGGESGRKPFAGRGPSGC
jgi:hypothetical protein